MAEEEPVTFNSPATNGHTTEEASMATFNVGGNAISYSLGSIIALIILIVCIVLAVIGQTLSPLMVLALIGGLALARLI